MLRYFFVFIFLIFTFPAYCETIPFNNCGDCVDLGITDINEYWGNAYGGTKNKTSYLGQTQVSININLNKIFGKKFGLLYISGINSRGNPLSGSNLKTLDFISNIENYNSTKLYEFYYENQISDIHIKIGKFDFSSDFGYDDLTSKFLNASMITSMVTNNNTFNMSNYGPASSVGIEVKYEKNDWYIKGGISGDNPYHIKNYNNFSNINSDKHGTDLYVKNPMLYIEYNKNVNYRRTDWFILHWRMV